MPSRDVDTITHRPAPVAPVLTQATAVEQTRAVAEVQAAVFVAQQNPRNMDRALADMRDTTGRLSIAEHAFYQVTNRGAGPTIHLMTELARIWGNLDYGVKELNRDDDAGVSEILAYASDLQTNTRNVRSFLVPHSRMKSGRREKLIDLGDIYLNNQNVGARAVRECISKVLPAWFRAEAEQRCRDTLRNGEDGGEPLAKRIERMVSAFGQLGVKLDQLEQKLGRKRGAWDGADVASMVTTYQSIQRHETTREDEFPQQRVTAAEIAGQAHTEQPSSPAPATPADEVDGWPAVTSPGSQQ
jgi:hypothetical protein